MVILVRVFNRALGKIVTRFVDILICNNGSSINIFYVINNCIRDRGISWSIVIALYVKSPRFAGKLLEFSQKSPALAFLKLNMYDKGDICSDRQDS